MWTKNKSRIPLDLYIELGPYKFSLQASVDHHGYSMNSGHYTASINCCGKTFHCNDNKITECNITDTYNSSTAYILLYKLMVCYGGNMSRRAFVVAGIVECLQPDRGGWELIDSYGAGTVVCPFITGRGIGTETCEMDNVFPPDDLLFGLDTYDSLCEYIYNCVFGSLISDVTYNYVSADGGRDGLWWPALPGHWLSYTGCWLSLLVMYWLLCLGCCFYF